MILSILVLFLNVLAADLEAYFDVKKQKKGKKIKHGQSSLFRGLVWAIVALALHYPDWKLAVLYAFLLGFEYWAIFDLFHNRFTGQPWYYSNKGFFDSILDGKENRYKKLLLKVILFYATFIVYLHL